MLSINNDKTVGKRDTLMKFETMFSLNLIGVVFNSIRLTSKEIAIDAATLSVRR